MTVDDEIVLRIPHSSLMVIESHLMVGRYCDVAETLRLIVSQASPQLVNLAKIADAEGAAMEAAATGVEVRKQ
jgi:hypothetical protein